MEMKLSTWKAIHLSMGGRITLIEAVMTSVNSEMTNISDHKDKEATKGFPLAREG